MSDRDLSDCFICRKHRGDIAIPGGPVYEDELLYAGHAALPPGEAEGYLGSLLVEPKRRVGGIAELADKEAQGLGLLVVRLSRTLTATEGAEHIYLFVLGHVVPHLHLWVVPRYPGTPREYWDLRVDAWPEAPRGGSEETVALCGRVRAHLRNESWDG